MEEEKFTKSNCDCEVCTCMNNAHEEWDSFVTKTNLQRRMKQAVTKIEKRIEKQK